MVWRFAGDGEKVERRLGPKPDRSEQMQRSTFIILLLLGLAAIQTFQLVNGLRTGRIRTRTGTVTRNGQPRRFWLNVYISYVVLLLCAGAILWALISPASFR
jgi:succinate dehydrogenase/fumarate reductase cytochrome b subunit